LFSIKLHKVCLQHVLLRKNVVNFTGEGVRHSRGLLVKLPLLQFSFNKNWHSWTIFR